MSTIPGIATIASRSSLRPMGEPLRWVGQDRVLLDDLTEYGLRRLVIARRDEPPEVADLLEMTAGMTDAEVYAWCVKRELTEGKGDFVWFLWLVWKEPT